MFCPFLSAGKSNRVECSRDCALYNGSLDGSRMECAIYSFAVNLGSGVSLVGDMSNAVDEIAGTLIGIEQDLPEK